MISALSSRLMLLKHSSPPPSSISPSPLVCLQQPWKLMVCPSTPFSPYVFITSLIGASIANQVMNRGVIRSRTGPDRTGPVWTEDRIRVKVWTEDRTDLRPVLDRTELVKPGTGPDRTGPVLVRSGPGHGQGRIVARVARATSFFGGTVRPY